MARKGGYSRSTNDEWIKTTRQHYAEAIRSADDMGQDLAVWLCDAIDHHAYRCELILLAEQYRRDCEASDITPQKWEEKYQPKRPKPSITMKLGQGIGPTDRNPRPKQ